MNRKKALQYFAFLIVSGLYTYCFVPNSFNKGGGSCYQGITALLDHFLLTICTLFNSISLAFLYKKPRNNFSKFFSFIATIIWTPWSILMTMSYPLDGLWHFPPFLLSTILIVKKSFNDHPK